MLKRQWALLGLLLVGCTTVPTAPMDDTRVLPDSGVESDRGISIDQGNPVEEMVAMPFDAGMPPPPDAGPPPPLPTGGCLRLSTFGVSHSPTNPVTALVRRYPSGAITNSNFVSFRLADGRYIFLQQLVGAAAGSPPASSVALGSAPNDNTYTCFNCVLIHYDCAVQADGTYRCANAALARTGSMNVTAFSTGPSSAYSSALYNVIFQQVSIDTTTQNSRFVRDGTCFTLDELRVNAELEFAPEPTPDAGTPMRDAAMATPDVRTATPDSGTGTGAPPEGEGLRQRGAPPSPEDLISYHQCTAAAPQCVPGMDPTCRLQAGAAQGTCTSECSSDTDCTSGGTCIRSAGGLYLNTATRGYCFRPCMANGCSVEGFGCATARRISGEYASVCVPQPWVTGDPTTACATRAESGLRECGMVSRITYTCTPGSPLTLGCVAGSAGAGCGMLGTCTGDPLLRVCSGDAACGSWGALQHADDECGVCPLSTVTCPPSGRVRVFAGGFDTSMPYTCFVQRR